MPNRLEPLNLVDFTGGLNLRANQFQLGPNESPEMINISIDPLGGIYSRKGWERWNIDDIVDVEVTPWDPRRAYLHKLSDGSSVVYIAAGGKIYWARPDAVFALLTGVNCDAVPHDADFAEWGDSMYIACGHTMASWRRTGTTAPFSLTPASNATFNNDYTTPVGNVAPQADVFETHSGYLFAAGTQEGGIYNANRLRWSHPNRPDDWAAADYLDIQTGGGRITGLISYEDHLVIFKTNSMWALYGYDQDSWQLVEKSSKQGCVSPQGASRNEQAIFFYSASDNGGIYAYSGERPSEISVPIRRALHEIIRPEMVWLNWVGRKLWVTLPWTYGGPSDESAAAFVFDPSLSQGGWVYFNTQSGSLGPLVAHSSVSSQPYPLAVVRSSQTACVVQLDKLDEAVDRVLAPPALGTTAGAYIVTNADAEIAVIGTDLEGEPFETVYRTPWVTADWPTRKKSWRRPDFVCRETGFQHELQIRSYRDYEEGSPKRQYSLLVPTRGTPARWGQFSWGDGTKWGQGAEGASIRRGSSFGMCRALQLRIAGLTPRQRWGVDAIVLKTVLRRFR